MNTEFRKAAIPSEIRSLAAFDRKVFPTDFFPPSEWKRYESYWLVLDGRKIGCCAFERQGDTLYIATTGILPVYQGKGFGQLLKAWEIAWARHHGFKRIETHSRQSNKAMIALNKKYGFRKTKRIPAYYEDPDEPAVVMTLNLT